MKLSSVYIYEKLNSKFPIIKEGNLSETDRYLRPFLYYSEKNSGSSRQKRKSGHVCVVFGAVMEVLLEEISGTEPVFWIFCLEKKEENVSDPVKISLGDYDDFLENTPYLCVEVSDTPGRTALMNELQQIFDEGDEWEEQIQSLMVANDGIDKILRVTSEFLQNPLLVMGVDFSLVAEAGREYLPAKARIYTDEGLNMEYVNALLGDTAFRNMEGVQEVVMFPSYINGCRSLNKNLFVDGRASHRLVLTESRSSLSGGDVCILDEVSEKLEFLLGRKAEENNPDYDMEQLFIRILSDRTADYVEVSRKLSELGWRREHRYMCLVLQITYLNQHSLSTKAICRYIKNKFNYSVSFLYKDEIVVYFNLSLLQMEQDEAASILIYFIRDSYLKAGYSRTMQGHMNLRRQYMQAQAALDVGSRKKPYIWVHYFDQIALTYILEQSTRRLPAGMVCHEGLLKLKECDEKNNTDYVQTLKVYLEQHLSATQAARDLFIHRSTFLYRLDKIKEILQSDLEDPDEIFYLELSFRILAVTETPGNP